MNRKIVPWLFRFTSTSEATTVQLTAKEIKLRWRAFSSLIFQSKSRLPIAVSGTENLGHKVSLPLFQKKKTNQNKNKPKKGSLK